MEGASCGTGADPPSSAVTGGAIERGLGSTGVMGLASTGRFSSRFFSSVRRKTRMVVRKALLGLQSSADRGECSQTGHDEGNDGWQASQMACSQQGRRKALTASLLQMAHLSLAGMSSWDSDLRVESRCQYSAQRKGDKSRRGTYWMSSARASEITSSAMLSFTFAMD